MYGTNLYFISGLFFKYCLGVEELKPQVVIFMTSSFLKFAKRADIFIAGHYYGSGSPYLFTRQAANLDDINLPVIIYTNKKVAIAWPL